MKYDFEEMGVRRQDLVNVIRGADADELRGAFYWDETPQGFYYWLKQCEKEAPLEIDVLKDMLEQYDEWVTRKDRTMSDTTHEAPERIVPSCVEALESYHQADMDGIMVLVSRQAIHETIDAYWARVETCEELEANINIKADFIEATINQLAESNQRIEELKKACDEEEIRSVGWAEVSQSNYQRAKAAEAKLEKALAELERLGFDFQCIVGRELKGQDDE